MAKLDKQDARFRIGEFTVLMNADDAKRVSRHQWKPIEGDQNAILFFTDIGSPAQPHFVLLHNFIANAPTGAFVEFIDQTRQGLDCRRTNLRMPRGTTIDI